MIQHFQIGFVLGHAYGERGNACARIGEREARFESGFARGRVHRRERDAVAFFPRRGER